jgi:hypothetical protein
LNIADEMPILYRTTANCTGQNFSAADPGYADLSKDLGGVFDNNIGSLNCTKIV